MNKTNKKTLVTLLAALIMLFSACFACLPQKSARVGAEEEPPTKNCTVAYIAQIPETVLDADFLNKNTKSWQLYPWYDDDENTFIETVHTCLAYGYDIIVFDLQGNLPPAETFHKLLDDANVLTLLYCCRSEGYLEAENYKDCFTKIVSLSGIFSDLDGFFYYVVSSMVDWYPDISSEGISIIVEKTMIDVIPEGFEYAIFISRLITVIKEYIPVSLTDWDYEYRILIPLDDYYSTFACYTEHGKEELAIDLLTNSEYQPDCALTTVPYYGNTTFTQLLTDLYSNSNPFEIYAYLLGFSPSYEIDINGLPVNVYSSFGCNGDVDVITGDADTVLANIKLLIEDAFLSLPNER